ncbi:MAG: BamA/TamA family outer membrane protein [Bacteroidales bacterium]|nr:BamA/TamA family outer membrane protein [Bacteroidales bacterium]
MMKRAIFISMLAVLSLLSDSIYAQDAQEKSKVKTGWNVGPLPAISYSTDKGFQYGVVCDLYDYGDGSNYPGYRHKFNVELSHFTKGSSNIHVFYDSKYLIPNIRLTAAVSYLPDTMSPFYGFNGWVSPYNKEFDSNKELKVARYHIKKNMLRALADFQGQIGASNFGWAAGIAYYNYSLGNIKNNDYDTDGSLYSAYVASGLIPEDQINGGNQIELKGGFVYDTRDMEAAPSKGMWAELYAVASPDFFTKGKYSYGRLVAHWRHYVPIVYDKLTFAYHIAYQGLIAGDAPFYTLSNIHTMYLKQVTSEGMGSKNTFRGAMLNRMLGNGYAWTNVELRYNIVKFDFIKQHWYVAVNPFFDAAMITQPYRLKEMKENLVLQALGMVDSQANATAIHTSIGAGVKLAMNRNFIISCEYARPFNRQDGNGQVYINLNYVF